MNKIYIFIILRHCEFVKFLETNLLKIEIYKQIIIKKSGFK